MFHIHLLVPAPTPLPVLSNVMARLTATLNNLNANVASTDSLLEQLRKDIQRGEDSCQGLQQDIEKSGKRYEWFMEMKTWVNDFAEFLDEKVVIGLICIISFFRPSLFFLIL